MKGKDLLIFGGLAALAYAAYRSSGISTTVKFLQYSISGLRFKLGNILSPEVVIKVDVYNPNQTSVPVQSMFGSISSGNTVLANFNNVTPITITGQTNQTVEVSAKISAINLLMKIITGQSLQILSITGQLKTPFYNIPINKTFDVRDAISGINTNVWQFKNLVRANRKKFNGREWMQKYRAAMKNGGFKGGFLQYVRQNNQFQVPAIIR